jgi:hypothetical protein
MRKIHRLSILCICLVALTTAAKAQLFGNEWIDYGKTYYKFKISGEGMYRINKATLDAAGIPSTITGNQFILFRDGQAVPLLVTTAGILGAGDYIEFYGKGPTGMLDKKLYANPNWHVNDSISLFSDTASYYLTYGQQTSPRYTQVTTPIPGNPGLPEPYCWFITGKYFKNFHMPGTTYSPNDRLHSAQFDCAEAYVDAGSPINSPAMVSLPASNIYPGGPNATVRLNVVAQDPYAVQVPTRVYANSQQIHIDTLQLNPQPSTAEKFVISMPSSLLQSTNTFSYTNNFNHNVFNLFGTAQAELEYARDFNVTGTDNFFRFKLKANSNPQYLEFPGFSGSAARIYDLTNQKWYSGTVSGNVARFYLDPSMTDRSLVFSNNSAASIAPVKSFNFQNYTVAPNVGNYIILTHKSLMTASNGSNYVQEYKDYRSSAAGGGYTVMIADVEELYDQFAYGIKYHPLAIKNFLQYAHTNWSIKPEYALLLGRGLLYEKIRDYENNLGDYPFPIVPTYGDPGSDVDFTNFGSNLTSKIKIGRISAFNGMEIGNYLRKIKDYEAALVPAAYPDEESELWKRKFIHIAGGSDIILQTTLLNTLNKGKNIVERPWLGAMVTTIAKNTTTPVDQAGSALVDAMIDSGVNWVTFHGHASSGNFDFNLNNPEKYNSGGRLPHLMALGCDVSQIFNLTNVRTISERYINATSGSITVLAQDNLGYTSFHEPYLQRFYRSMSMYNYGTTYGTHYNHTYDSTLKGYNILNNANNFNFTEAESMILLGDPAVRVFGLQKYDFHIADDGITSDPGTVTTTLDSFDLKVVCYNLGKAAIDTMATDTANKIWDTVYVKVEHINPQNVTTTVGTYPVINNFNKNTLSVRVPIDRLADIGLNKYRATIDPENKFDENSETNNSGLFTLFIFSDKLIPVHPPEFAIVGQQNVTLKASTLNPFRPDANYKIEIDTTELFNSPKLQQHSTTSMGGVIKWQPNVTYQDSMVYYWRAALDSGGNTQPNWSTSSFIYLPQKAGWNQSHYFQYKKDNFNTITVDNNRLFNFVVANNNLDVFNRVLATGIPVNDSKVMFNDVDIQRAGCPPFVGTLQVMVIDTLTAKRWINPVGGTAGAYPRCLNTRNSECFEFPLNSINGRTDAKNFINSIPAGHYVLLRNLIYQGISTPTYVNDWQQDGADNLYTAIKNLGFTDIDSFYKERSFILMCKKGGSGFPTTQVFSQGANDRVEAHFVLPSRWYTGEMLSKNVGPAKEWQELKWKTSASDTGSYTDTVSVKVIGIDNNGNETELFETQNTDTSLAGINAAQYPNLRLEWHSKDSINNSSAQLNYWRVHYVPVPEAALNPAGHFVFNDSMNKGEMANLSLAIEELAGLPMDSMLVKYRIIDAGGVAHDLGSSKYKKLSGGDTLHASISFDPGNYPGMNFLFVEANPDNNQPEQYHPNNLGYLPFRVFADKLNPLIDVTFDGIHILDRDIVSAKPFIKITLKDENKFLKLDDTSLVDVSIRHLDDNTPTDLVFDGTTMKFLPAASAEKNEAIIEYRPVFLKDGFYELSVNGKDKSGNKSGATDYRITFEVINKSTITNILNYPNPFSTSTAFLFTLTGSQIPSQFKIQVLSVTGKVVREITKAELGPLHVGRNITEYKWDGKDQYGQMLGNGVYLYRVVTTINGEDVEHRTSGADKFTQKGYGKMYIMR